MSAAGARTLLSVDMAVLGASTPSNTRTKRSRATRTWSARPAPKESSTYISTGLFKGPTSHEEGAEKTWAGGQPDSTCRRIAWPTTSGVDVWPKPPVSITNTTSGSTIVAKSLDDRVLQRRWLKQLSISSLKMTRSIVNDKHPIDEEHSWYWAAEPHRIEELLDPWRWRN